VCLKVGYDNVLLVSFRQHVTPPPLLGRVNATVRVVLTGAVTVGSALAGAVGQLASPGTALWVGAGVLATVWVPLLASPLRGARTLAEAA
jgi:hypothetical protein